MACAPQTASHVVVVTPSRASAIVALTTGVAAQSNEAILLATAACASPLHVDTVPMHAELLVAATEVLTRDASCSYVDSHTILQRSAVRILDLCQIEQAHTIPDAHVYVAIALQYLTTLSSTMPLDTLLADKTMIPRIVATTVGRRFPDNIRALAWTTALALSRRLVESPHNFQARIASARLLPLFERTHSLLEFASTQPRRVFANTDHAHWLRKELLSALQLLCNLGSGDVYFASRLNQLHMPSALLAFANADIVGMLGDDMDAAALAARMQGAARRLQQHLLDDP